MPPEPDAPPAPPPAPPPPAAAPTPAAGPTMADLADLDAAVRERVDELADKVTRLAPAAAKAGVSGPLVAVVTVVVLAVVGVAVALIQRARGAA